MQLTGTAPACQVQGPESEPWYQNELKNKDTNRGVWWGGLGENIHNNTVDIFNADSENKLDFKTDSDDTAGQPRTAWPSEGGVWVFPERLHGSGAGRGGCRTLRALGTWDGAQPPMQATLTELRSRNSLSGKRVWQNSRLEIALSGKRIMQGFP